MGQHPPTGPSTLQLRQFPTPTSTRRTPIRPHSHHTWHSHPSVTYATLQTLQWTQHSIPHLGRVQATNHEHLLSMAQTPRHASSEHRPYHQQAPHISTATMAPTQTIPCHTHLLSCPRSLWTQTHYHRSIHHTPRRSRDSTSQNILPPPLPQSSQHHMGGSQALHTTPRLTFRSKQHPPPHHSDMACPEVQMGNQHPVHLATGICILEAEEAMGQRQNNNIVPQQYTGPPAQGRCHRIRHNGPTNLAISTWQCLYTRTMESPAQLHAHHLHFHSSQHDQRWPSRIFQQRPTWETATQPTHPHPPMETKTQSGHNYSGHYTGTWLLPLHPHWIFPPQQAHSQPQSPPHPTHTWHRTPQLPIQRLPSPRTNMATDPRHGHRQSNITNPCQHTHHTTRSQLATSIPTTTAPPPSSTRTVHLPSLCGQPHDHRTTTHLQQPPLSNPRTTRLYQLPIQLELVGDSHFLGFTLHLANRSITFNQPTSPWQIRDACSAGSRRLTLSGLLSRGTTIHRYSFPSNIVHSSLETLLQAYISKGHNETLCRHTLKKLFSTCNPVAWTDLWTSPTTSPTLPTCSELTGFLGPLWHRPQLRD